MFKNENGRPILLHMVEAIHSNMQYLGEIDGLVGDGDHGANMNKGFTVFSKRLGNDAIGFADGLNTLGMILMNEIGGSMGPIYGTIFTEMAFAAGEAQEIDLQLFVKMMDAGLTGLYDIVDARVGDKTLVDTLAPACDALHAARDGGQTFAEALTRMRAEAMCGRDSTKNMIARFGRSSRLGERSRGVLDAGAVSCCILLTAMAEGIQSQLL